MSEPEDEPGLRCPCGSTDINVGYTDPLMFSCQTCKRRLIDENCPGIPVITKEQAQSKRPRLYGLPFCPDCGHGEHQLPCKILCKECQQEKDHVYKLRYAKEKSPSHET